MSFKRFGRYYYENLRTIRNLPEDEILTTFGMLLALWDNNTDGFPAIVRFHDGVFELAEGNGLPDDAGAGTFLSIGFSGDFAWLTVNDGSFLQDLYRSADLGDNWEFVMADLDGGQLINVGTPVHGSDGYYWQLKSDFTEDTIFFQIYRSADGVVWELQYDSTDDGVLLGFASDIVGFDVDPTDPNKLALVVDDEEGIFESYNHIFVTLDGFASVTHYRATSLGNQANVAGGLNAKFLDDGELHIVCEYDVGGTDNIQGAYSATPETESFSQTILSAGHGWGFVPINGGLQVIDGGSRLLCTFNPATSPAPPGDATFFISADRGRSWEALVTPHPIDEPQDWSNAYYDPVTDAVYVLAHTQFPVIKLMKLAAPFDEGEEWEDLTAALAAVLPFPIASAASWYSVSICGTILPVAT